MKASTMEFKNFFTENLLSTAIDFSISENESIHGGVCLAKMKA